LADALADDGSAGAAGLGAPDRRFLEGLSRRTVLVGLLLGLPASALFLYLATRNIDLHEVEGALGRAEPAWIGAAVVAVAVLYALQAERWRLLIGPEGRVPRGRLLQMVIGSVAVNNVVPGRPGEIMRAYWLGRAAGLPLARCLSSVIVDRVADVVILAALLASTLPLVPHPAWLTSLVVAALALALVAAGGVLIARRHGRTASASAGPMRRYAALRHQLSLLTGGISAAARGGRLAGAAAITIVAWLVCAVAAWCVAYSLGIVLSPAEALFVTTVISLGVIIPSSPGFVGTYQWLGVASLGLLGVGRVDAFAFSLLVQAVWFVPTTLAGVVLACRLALASRVRAAVAVAPAERNAV
jgi:glycosyltransferase 2 family protein